ncbi:ABC-three component system protein [Halovibrio sp. HP20-59]|nr:ABC-three component system protein [Halovibrio sp. HP20-59]MEA2120544.1 ABC-three component system protein [Halovibrio sp. HP20-59]
MSEVNINNTAVIFIHGFTGTEGTWVNEDGARFSTFFENSLELPGVEFYYFSYYTRVLSISNSTAKKVVTGIINKILPVKLRMKIPVVKKNTPISEIAQEFLTYLQHEFSESKNLIFVCHSMGGLVVKSAIIDILENAVSFDHNIIGYCSLATPHKGSIPSILMSPFNINAKEMKPLDNDNSVLNDKWINNSDKIAKTLYVRAKSDEVVAVSSAVPFSDVKKFPIAVVEADHTSVCKPTHQSDTICKVVKKFLVECLSAVRANSVSLEGSEEEISAYDKEIFVIKMVLANVEELLVEDAKESFFLAEGIEKQASKPDRKIIKDLKVKIISAYKTVAGSNSSKSSSEIVGLVHEKLSIQISKPLSVQLITLTLCIKKVFCINMQINTI